MRRWGWFVTAMLVAIVTGATGSPARASTPPVDTFRGVNPVRLADTRASGSTTDGAFKGAGPIGAGGTYSVKVTGRGGVPATGVGAVALNVTAVNPTAASFLTIYPTGQPRPNAANLSLAPERTLPNMVIVPVGAGGQITIYNDQGTTHVTVDVLGWFPATGSFSGLTPRRLADTRASGSTTDGAFKGAGPIGAGGTYSVKVTGRGGVPATGVGAVALNVTAVNPTAASFLTIYPTGQPRPNAANLSLAPGRTLPNMVIVPVGTGGQITIYNDQGTTHVTVDVLGWFPSGATFGGLVPRRLADTRLNGQTVDGQFVGYDVISGNGTYSVKVTGRGGVPATGVGAVVLNVTAVSPSAASFLTVYPTGTPRAGTANLNTVRGRTLPNMVIVPVGTGGQITIYNDKGTTHATVDVLGWFPSTTTLISATPTGAPGNEDSFEPAISGNGRFIAFESSANNLVPGDTNNVSDIFVHDRQTGTTSRVSVSSTGVQANNGSYRPSISFDGRYVAFESLATNLVAGDTNGVYDIFVHDRQTGTTSRVSVNSAGVQSNDGSHGAHISSTGRYVTFTSAADNLVPGDTNNQPDVFVRDRQTGTTVRASVSTSNVEGDGESYDSMLSGDGRYVVFASAATNLVPGDTNNAYDVFVHDLSSGITTRVSVSSTGVQGNAFSYDPVISRDGTVVAFGSDASNLVPGDTNGYGDVFVHVLATGTTTRVSLSSTGIQGDHQSAKPRLSGDGRFVAFETMATNLVPGDTNNYYDVMVRDRQAGTTRRASVGTGGNQLSDDSFYGWVSDDGRFVAFATAASNVVIGVTNTKYQVYLRDLGPH